jgi:hypothetical protein
MYNVDERTGDYKRDSIGSPGHVLSFLGVNSSTQFGEQTNYAFYVDTAYVNRGTGWIKPQYMLAVDAYIPDECGVCNPQTGITEGANSSYVIGRYMYNTSMYAKTVVDSVMFPNGTWGYTDKFYDAAKGDGIPVSATDTVSGYLLTGNNFNKVQPVKYMRPRTPNGAAYLHDGYWERFAFAWAIHKGDSLYVLKGVDLEPMYKGATDDPYQLWLTLTKEYGTEGKYVDFQKMIDWCTAGTYREAYYPAGDGSLFPEMRTYRTFKDVKDYDDKHTIGLHAIIALDDNTHKDWVFSFRLTVKDATDFVIESETTDRDTGHGAMIRSGYGGWVKIQNGVPVLSRSDEKEVMGQSAVFNVKPTNSRPVSNETADRVSHVRVTGGTGNVAIHHAAGKKVRISNLKGQIIYFGTISSDDAVVAVSPGLVIVAVNGEKTAKVLVR